MNYGRSQGSILNEPWTVTGWYLGLDHLMVWSISELIIWYFHADSFSCSDHPGEAWEYLYSDALRPQFQ